MDDSGNPTPTTSQGDLFSYKLDYETAGFYDGNIGKQSWHNGTDLRSYTFTYDAASRLKSATYTGVNGEDYSLPTMSYDRNGNITNLQRKGKIGSSYGLMDNLSYSYNGNQLSQITDAVAGNNTVDFVQRGSAGYTYYNDGSLKSDANEQIERVLYDKYLQQPVEIQLTAGRGIDHYYDGTGKLLKTVYSTGEVWEYADDFIYKNGGLYQIQEDEGRILYQNGVFTYEFQYTDHLGNTRVGFRANNGQLEKVAETSFDPWGVVLNGLGQVNATQNRWEFLNREKESTFNLNYIRLGARGYNPTNGRFDRIDMVAQKREWITPYNFCQNNPIMRIDPNGALDYPIVTITKEKTGKTAEQRVLGYSGGAVTEVDLYKVVVTDTEDSKFRMEFSVTRDAWVDPDGSGVAQNVAFEPQDGNINHFTAKAMTDGYPAGNNTEALKLTQYGSEVVHAEPNKTSVDMGYRTKSDVAAGVMIHVGGNYKLGEKVKTAASEGCFGVCNITNSKSNPSNSYSNKVLNAIQNQAAKSQTNPGKIEVVIQKRTGNEYPKTNEY